ncbi:unnamed protein product [Pleuronectes platessa]|uniref:Uncharacterized protein n=1 Tax=Pleuronectes platessa TaxID=8262 RepID=A0A9N7U499_PLEPL|nr:unnamed protein product [Pleuronectes platessa]
MPLLATCDTVGQTGPLLIRERLRQMFVKQADFLLAAGSRRQEEEVDINVASGLLLINGGGPSTEKEKEMRSISDERLHVGGSPSGFTVTSQQLFRFRKQRIMGNIQWEDTVRDNTLRHFIRHRVHHVWLQGALLKGCFKESDGIILDPADRDQEVPPPRRTGGAAEEGRGFLDTRTQNPLCPHTGRFHTNNPSPRPRPGSDLKLHMWFPLIREFWFHFVPSGPKNSDKRGRSLPRLDSDWFVYGV